MTIRDAKGILSKAPVIPVLTIGDASKAVPLARALVEGGLPVIEITLRTSAALAAIAAIAKEVSGAIVGAGTVTQPSDIDDAVRAGARYLVTPGTPARLADALTQASVPVVPGCATPSEALELSARGFQTLKFFPAEASGGTAWLKSVAGPLPGLTFCPTGGIDIKNAARYLALPNVIAVGGSWVAPKDAVASGDFARVTALAKETAALKR